MLWLCLVVCIIEGLFVVASLSLIVTNCTKKKAKKQETAPYPTYKPEKAKSKEESDKSSKKSNKSNKSSSKKTKDRPKSPKDQGTQDDPSKDMPHHKQHSAPLPAPSIPLEPSQASGDDFFEAKPSRAAHSHSGDYPEIVPEPQPEPKQHTGGGQLYVILGDIKLEPGLVKLRSQGHVARHRITNMAKYRMAAKLKCTDNNLFRLTPVYNVMEPNQTLEIDIQRLPGPKKPDVMHIEYLQIAPNDNQVIEAFKKPNAMPKKVQVQLNVTD